MAHKMTIMSGITTNKALKNPGYHIQTLGAPIDEEYKNFNSGYACNPSYCCGSALVSPKLIEHYNKGVVFAFSDQPLEQCGDESIMEHYTFPDGTVLNIKLSTLTTSPPCEDDDEEEEL